MNPYTRLRNEASGWISKALRPRVAAMFVYPEAKLRETNWNIHDLAERTRAAQQLGYEVRARYEDGKGLIFEYFNKPPEPPYWY